MEDEKMTYEDKKKILSLDPNQIYEEYFISGDVWLFKNQFNKDWFVRFDEFKKFISKKLDVHYNDIGIAGSAKLGFSLNPKKELHDFTDESDVDIILVSYKLYKKFWSEYLKDSYNPAARVDKIAKISFGIFRKYIFLDGFRNNEFYNKWLKKTMGFEKDIQVLFNIKNDIHYRIFESWDAVKGYYLNSIITAKNQNMEDIISD